MEQIEKGKSYVVFIPAHEKFKDDEAGAIGDKIVEKTGCKINHLFALQGQSKVQFFAVDEIKEEVKKKSFL
jgi:hypothetical protein